MLEWLKKSPERTVARFIDAMNARDFAELETLLADNFLLIDDAGRTRRGREQCLKLFAKAIEVLPDYKLAPSSIVLRGDHVLISGQLLSTHSAIAKSTQWRARADRSKLLEWQSFAHGQTISLIAEIDKALV